MRIVLDTSAAIEVVLNRGKASALATQLSQAEEVIAPDIPAITLHREAFLRAELSKRPAYDMFYFALARREDAALLTLDTGLKSLAAKQGVRVIG